MRNNSTAAIGVLDVLAAVSTNFNRRPELWRKQVSGPSKQVSQLQDSWDGISVANAEIFRYASFDGPSKLPSLSLRAQPRASNFRLSSLCMADPLVHLANYNAWAQLLVAHGYAAVMPNPRGSTG